MNYIKAFFLFLNRNKTKITGGLLVAIGSLQANPMMVQSLLTPRQYAVFTIGAGLFVALLGFLNNPKPQDGDQ